MFIQILKYLNCLCIKSIILPTKVRTCGRPKGAVLTTISLPKKRSGQKTETKTKGTDNDVVDVNNMTMENDIADPIIYIYIYYMTIGYSIAN